MKLTGDQRRALLDIVIRLEDGGTPPPRIAGDVGQFLADIAALRADAEGLLPHDGAFVRGSAVGPIRLLPLAPLAEQIRPDPMGEVASTVAVSDELGVRMSRSSWKLTTAVPV